MYRRNLPHWHPAGAALFLTWRLHGTLPRVRAILNGRAFRDMDQALDCDTAGPRWMADSAIAKVVMDTILEAPRKRPCQVHAFVVMPNHVHVLLESQAEVAKVTQWMKGASARRANLLLNRTGHPFWQDESFDHWPRGDAAFKKIADYIENNPVLAGLATGVHEWPYSSAFGREPAQADSLCHPAPGRLF